ncbi:MAG TPA: tRNA (N(6)-L-threonylcarbamoyladenosine(37)-C(2))-methylthiotransferase MtaB [Sulfurovum sp.]|jgi:MiaB-like tRNA modifying enzyme|nr:MAG: tRNA (N(6)-L-threonylcarbamoyladenosine(37)-C(2))-methylthiotransferase MtaB [Sulfurovum sp. 35-42-20]OYY57173.1 MAG: tRNA (N(6)-L-threonylcarbamoyladenosine(37)-C(2))-methylthiotransferase MtaB [Sulfurovum sp. 28-43-6]OYZ25036.1 MAG: tRNA (N(6)-L-threonylcarbamoyladenosine(37)-C(2))-methylthiotransferase MtaB [Sulfurovum sp. 16-42-52]OYZ49397.1 MAG: tRNA (N(6)-L-threonylcarbamoyladenosine(37)-C(2))-methylthiotransferase MtaB [Sulfurovum sp. 24-42-9]OZA45009.1 MAG: tRNA (N(6)-L-threonyl
MQKKVYFKTFGCRTNQFDTQVMMSKLQEFELTEDELLSDIIVVNSCTVTNGADSSVRNYIASMQRKNPHAKVVLAGCGSHSKGESLFEEKKVFGVMGHSEKENINAILKNEQPFYQIGDLEHIDSTIVEEFVGKSRAFIKIQEGCDFRCSYCIIPSVRGNARSHKEETILEQISKLAANGFGEFILTGTNVGSYGQDHNTSMAKLLKKMSLIRGVRRIRIGSLEPIQIDDEFLELLSEPWMARHMHIALQHTSDKMLTLMNRRNEYKTDLQLFQKIAEHGYALGTDYIVGHPGEDDKEWSEAIARVKELPLTHVHAFTYSKRDNTPSATMKPEIKGNVAKERHHELTDIIKAKNFLFRREHTHNLEVLLESGQGGVYHGFDQYFNKVTVSSDEDLSANWVLLNNVEVGSEGNKAIL